MEVVDESGQLRILLGQLGYGDGATFGVSVLATEPATGVHLTADRSSAGLALSRLGEEVVDCRTFAGDGEAAASLDVGEGGSGPFLSVEIAPDGSVTVRLHDVTVSGE